MKKILIEKAKTIVSNCHLKRCVTDIVSDYNHDIEDAMIIFVNSEREVDAFWSCKDRKSAMVILKALIKGLQKDVPIKNFRI